MNSRLALLIGGTLGLWVLVFIPARLFLGEITTLYTSAALALCLIPTAATLVWSGRTVERMAEHQLIMVLGGTGFRMAFVLCGGLALYGLFPVFQQTSFWICILVFYLGTLALEMVLLVGHLQKSLTRRDSKDFPR